MDLLTDANFIGKLAIAIFLAIVFLQSGIDKIFDWKGNVDWLKGHFSKTFLSPFVIPMLFTLTVVEILASLVSSLGIFSLLGTGDDSYILYGMTIAIIAFLMLLFGQRIAKDYAGAQTIVIYLGVTLLGLLFF